VIHNCPNAAFLDHISLSKLCTSSAWSARGIGSVRRSARWVLSEA